MHVRFTADAEADLDDLQAFLEPRSAQGYLRIFTAILSMADQLGAFPLLGRPGDVAGTREINVPATPYKLIYRIADEYHVDILRVYHMSRRWPPEADL